MNKDLSSGVTWSKVEYRENLQNTLQDMFPTSPQEQDEKVKSAIAKYIRYKMEYVKHIKFNPYEDDVGKFIQCRIHYNYFRSTTVLFTFGLSLFGLQ